MGKTTCQENLEHGIKYHSQNRRMTVFIASPNNYADVFQVFYQCFKKYWADCPYEIVLATNNQEYPDIRVINNYKSNDSWTERSLAALKQIDTKYVLVICDDMFLTKKIDNRKIERILDTMDQYKIHSCRLKACRKGKKVEDSEELIWLNKRMPYAMNLLKNIYDREFLIELLGDGTKSSWDLERQWVADTLDAPNEFYTDVIGCRKEVLVTLHGISKGKWFPLTVEKLKRMGIKISSERECISKLEEIRICLASNVGSILSPGLRKRIKKCLSRFGFKFVTDN